MTPYETARNLVQLLLKGELSISQEMIREKVKMAVSMLNSQGMAEGLSIEELIKEIETLYAVWVPHGSILDNKDDLEHIPWLYDCKSSISWDFWDRYQRYLEEEKAWAVSIFSKPHLGAIRFQFSKLQRHCRQVSCLQKPLVITESIYKIMSK